MSALVVRCSSIGKLMSDPKPEDIDPSLVTPKIVEILSRSRRTDDERDLLEGVKRHSLSAGAKAHVRSIARQDIFGFEPSEVDTRPILKGRAVEEACIELLARLTGRPLVKNTERRSDGLITGECDVWDAPIRHGRDVKAAYSMDTMPIVLADCYDKHYEWQMRGYMSKGLWDAQSWSVDYLLVNTPPEFIGFEPQDLHFVDHIEERHRWTTWTVERDMALEALMLDKVAAARRYYRQVIEEFDRTHGGKPGKPAPAFKPPSRLAPRSVPAPAPKAVPDAIPELTF